MENSEQLGNMLSELKEYSHLCIYSAGNRAKELLQMYHSGYLDIPKPEYFLVSERKGNREYNRNPESIEGIPVYELQDTIDSLVLDNTAVLVAAMEHYHDDIKSRLSHTSYKNIYYLTDVMESILITDYMEYCFSKYNLKFEMTQNREFDKKHQEGIMTYMVQCVSDVGLDETRQSVSWITPLQAGAALTSQRIADVTDAEGDNISEKNPYYNEMTGLYWVWKNTSWEYTGICHYRRRFESDIVLQYLTEDMADVILPMPMSVYPNLRGYYGNWGEDIYYSVMLDVIHELEPDYYETAIWCAGHEIFIPNNICIAKRDIFDDYCHFAFEIIDEVERRMDKYSGRKQKRCWESEHVSTIYFMKHNHDYRIVFSNLKRFW